MKADGAFFQLRKWYVDCVTADGTAFVGYAARIRLGAVVVPYQAYLLCPPGEPARSRYSFGDSTLPTVGAEGLEWVSDGLSLGSRWTRKVPSVRRTLLDDQEIGVQWRCHIPAGVARVEGISSTPKSGEGYAEEVVLVGDPRKLPIDELLWGRFVAPEQSLTWIRWIGPKPLTLVAHNGVVDPGATVEAGRVRARDGRCSLDLPEQRVLRDSTVGATLFPDLTLLRRLIPRQLRDLRETKWLSRVRSECPGASDVEGWALHERVQWP